MSKRRRFVRIIFLVLKITGFVIVSVLLLFCIATWIIYEKKNDFLIDTVQNTVNESQSGQLKIKSASLKLLKNFPHVTIQLNEIDYYEHHDSIRPRDEKPVIQAGSLFISFELMPLLHDELKIVRLGLANTSLNLFSYANGELNITRALKKPVYIKPAVVANKTAPQKKQINPPAKIVKPKTIPNVKPALNVDLELVQINNLRINFSSYGSSVPVEFLINDLEAGFYIGQQALISEVGFTARMLNLNNIDSTLAKEELTCSARFIFNRANKTITIPSAKFFYAGLPLIFRGKYDLQNNQNLDLQFDGTTSDLKLFTSVIKAEAMQQNPAIIKHGKIFIKGRISGELKNQSPLIDVTFNLKDLTLRLPGKTNEFKDLGFDARFTSGKNKDYSEARIEIKNLRGTVPGGYIRGNISFANFVSPMLYYKLDARLNINDYDKVFRFDFIKNPKGMILIHADFDGSLKMIAKHQSDYKRSSVIILNNVSFLISKTGQAVSGLSAKIETRKNRTSIQKLSCKYGKNDFQLDATVDNLLYNLLYKEKLIEAAGTVSSGQFYTRDLLFDSSGNAEVQDRISKLNFDFRIFSPNDQGKDSIINRKIHFDVSNFSMNLDKLPDIKLLNTSGWFQNNTGGFKLGLDEFHADMPSGSVDVTGNLFMPEKRKAQIDAHLEMNRFPWTYIKELIAEISSTKVPNAKNLPLSKMEIVTADLDLSTKLVTFPFDIEQLDVRKSRVHFYFPGTDSISTDISKLTFEKVHFMHPENSGSITGLKNMSGMMELEKLKIPGLQIANMNINATGKDDQIDLDFTRETEIIERQKGEIKMDISKNVPSYTINYSATDVSLENFMKILKKKKILSGNVDFSVNFNATGDSWTNIKNSFSGDFEITGNNLKFYGIDIDDAFKKYQESQNFNLVDLGAVVVAGPLGLVATKGSDFISLAQIKLDSTKQTSIKTLFSKWELNNEIIISKDVAFTTKVNRIAIDGKIDFGKDSIPGLTIAVVDKNGCSLLEQTLEGKTGALKSGKVKIAKTLFGSVTNSVDAVVGKDCIPFYTGSIKNPEKK